MGMPSDTRPSSDPSAPEAMDGCIGFFLAAGSTIVGWAAGTVLSVLVHDWDPSAVPLAWFAVPIVALGCGLGAAAASWSIGLRMKSKLVAENGPWAATLLIPCVVALVGWMAFRDLMVPGGAVVIVVFGGMTLFDLARGTPG